MNRKSLLRLKKPGVFLRRTISPILFIVITGSDQVNVETQVNKVLWVHSFNLLLFYGLSCSHAAGLTRSLQVAQMSWELSASWKFICPISYNFQKMKKKKFSQNNLTIFPLSTQIIKVKFHFQVIPFAMVFHNQICFLIKFFICPSFTEDIRHS